LKARQEPLCDANRALGAKLLVTGSFIVPDWDPKAPKRRLKSTRLVRSGVGDAAAEAAASGRCMVDS